MSKSIYVVLGVSIQIKCQSVSHHSRINVRGRRRRRRSHIHILYE